MDQAEEPYERAASTNSAVESLRDITTARRAKPAQLVSKSTSAMCHRSGFCTAESTANANKKFGNAWTKSQARRSSRCACGPTKAALEPRNVPMIELTVATVTASTVTYPTANA